MDGAWALYEAWVRLQHGDIDTALVFSSGISSRGDLREVLCLQLDPTTCRRCGPTTCRSPRSRRARWLDADGRTEADLAEVAARSRRDALGNPYAQVRGDVTTEDLLAEPPVVAPLRAGDCPPVSDGAAAVVLVAGDRAREVCERPAWIRGIDHRIEPHYPGVRDLTTCESTRLAGEHAGVGDAPVDVAELSAPFSHQELILRDALGLGDDVEVNPSGGALAANPVMVTGLIRIGEAFRQINEQGKTRTLAHATSGPCLQQNLVCVLEGELVMAERCAVVGVGQTHHAKVRDDVSLAGLLREAALRALDDAEMTWRDIDAVVIGTAPDSFEGVMMPELYLADALGAAGKPIMRVHTAGSVGGLDRRRRRPPRPVRACGSACSPSPSRSSPRATPRGAWAAVAAAASAPAATSPRTSAPTSSARRRPSTSAGWWR